MVEPKSEDNNWLALESNPEVINSYINEIGFDTSKYLFYDILGTEEWAQAMIPQPVLAIMLLYPIKEHTEQFNKQEEEKILKDGQKLSEKVYFMYQYANNACGTVGILHTVMNLMDKYPGLVRADSYLHKFFLETKDKSPQERGEHLVKSDSIEEAHKKAVEKGETQVEEVVNTHFICFVEKDGDLYELDGRKEFPINHGPTTPETLLKDACVQIKKFMDRDPNELRFTTLVLATSESVEDQN